MIHSAAVRALFHHLVDGYDYTALTKRLPDWVGDLDVDQKHSLLDGLWWGDGSVSAGRGHYTTTSDVLQGQVRDLLWAVGAPAGAQYSERTDARPEYANTSPSWAIRTTAERTPPKSAYGAVDEKYVYSRVRAVRDVSPVGEVFDFEVPIDHSFMTDSYVVHNSAAGSIVSYALDVTTIDPIKYNLYFERFLNPGRKSMPDIDIDVERDRRYEVRNYVRDKYGADFVAYIATQGVFHGRSAIKAAARIHEIPPTVANAVSATFPQNGKLPIREMAGDKEDITKKGDADKDAELRREWDEGADFRKAVRKSGAVMLDVVEDASNVEGYIQNFGKHAAGILITPKPLTNYVPLVWEPRDGDDLATCGYDKDDAESIGGLKMDLLGLVNLTTIRQCVEQVEANTGRHIDVNTLPLDDKKTFALLQRADTEGVFQLASCLAGDTRVSGKKISDLYEAQESGNPLTTRTTSTYLDEGRVHHNDIIRVVKSGEKPVSRMVTDSGKMIESTAAHAFMTKDGWKTLGEIGLGDEVLVDQKTRHMWYRRCLVCGTQLDKMAVKARWSTRCYKCSATFHSNPSSDDSRASISRGAKATFDAGRVNWATGLSADTDERLARAGAAVSARMRGKTYETLYGPEKAATLRTAASERMSGSGNHMFGKPPAHRKGGFRDDLGHYVRSTWEADYARVLNHLDVKYEYERRSFEVVLPGGVVANYTPDFYLPAEDKYVEIKGFMQDIDQMKIDALVEQYPEVSLEVISSTRFAEFEMQYKDLVAWECPRVPEHRQRWEVVESIAPTGTQMTYDLVMKAPGNNFLANGFVVHNSGMRDLLRRVWPTHFEDLSAVLALYRPGPMGTEMHYDYADRKNGRQRITVEHPDMLAFTKNTHGLVVYQEQMLALAQNFAGFTAGEADTLRKATGKKDADLLATQEDKFKKGMAKNGYDKRLGDKLWAKLPSFAAYSFNAAHSMAYAMVAYQTAYLKANYPAEYAAACVDTLANPALQMKWARSLGVMFDVPDVNESDMGARAFGGKVRLGLSGIKGLGNSACGAIVADRLQGGDFISLSDFLVRAAVTKKVNKAAIEALIDAGALDSLASSRGEMKHQLPALILAAKAAVPKESDGWDSDDGGLLGDLEAPAVVLNFDETAPESLPLSERIGGQVTRLGVFLGVHPMALFEKHLMTKIPDVSRRVSARMRLGSVAIHGIVSAISEEKKTRRSSMRTVTIESAEGYALNVKIFGDDAADIVFGGLGSLLVVEGTLQEDEWAKAALGGSEDGSEGGVGEDSESPRELLANEWVVIPLSALNGADDSSDHHNVIITIEGDEMVGQVAAALAGNLTPGVRTITVVTPDGATRLPELVCETSDDIQELLSEVPEATVARGI